MEIKNEFNTAKEMVESILAEDQRSRNDYLWLILQVWQRKQAIKVFIPFEDMKNMIAPETITRCCRLIQHNLGRWLPTDPKVAVARKIKEEQVKEYFSDNQWYITEFMRLKYGFR